MLISGGGVASSQLEKVVDQSRLEKVLARVLYIKSNQHHCESQTSLKHL
jgi:hypothetical protein